MDSLTQHRSVAQDLAYKAGAIIKEAFNKNIKIHTKSDTSIVTDTDLVVNRLVLNILSSSFPYIPIIAEEESSKQIPGQEYAWICDPLDGTAVFAHGIPTCAFSLALTYQGESVLGVVYDPFLDRLFVAEKGKGTTLNNTPVRVCDDDSLYNTMIGMSLWAGSKYNFLELMPKFKTANILPLNAFSTVYMGMLVAAGYLSGAIYLDGHAYDVAALKIIVEEAGGRVTDLFGREQRYDTTVRGCLMSNGILHDQYLTLLKESNIEV